jgi:predicted site-specific integrase-resolvase
MEQDLITTTELCKWLRISKATASRWRKEGLPYTGRERSLRYSKKEVQEWLEKQKK